MRRLTTAIRSEKMLRANVIECTYTNLDSIVYYTPSLYIDYCSYATNLYFMVLDWIMSVIVTQRYYNIMGPPSYMRSVVYRNVVMRLMIVFYKRLSLLNSGNYVVTTHWCKYWPPVRFPPTDEKSWHDLKESILFNYQAEASCVPTTRLYLTSEKATSLPAIMCLVLRRCHSGQTHLTTNS